MALSLVGIPVLLVAAASPRVPSRSPTDCCALLRREPLGAETRLRQGRGAPLLLCRCLVRRRPGCWALARAVTDADVDALPVITVAFAFAYVVGMVAFVFPGGLGVREVVLAGALARRPRRRRGAGVGRAPAPVARSPRSWCSWASRRWWRARPATTAERRRRGSRRRRRDRAPPARGGLRAVGRKSRAKKEAAAGGASRRPRPPPSRHRARRRRLRAPLPPLCLVRARRRRRLRRGLRPARLAALPHAYYGGRFDLGNMVQAVYNTAHGRFLEITTAGPEPRQMSRLGSHVDPIIAVFALPWLVWPSPVMLLTLQSADRRHVGVAGVPARRARHPRPARRRPARRRPAPVPGARLRGAERVPPRDAGDAAPPLRLPVPRRGPLAARSALPRRWRRSARRRSRSCSPSWAPTSPSASARGGTSS